jgi:hypothetical protein
LIFNLKVQIKVWFFYVSSEKIHFFHLLNQYLQVTLMAINPKNSTSPRTAQSAISLSASSRETKPIRKAVIKPNQFRVRTEVSNSSITDANNPSNQHLKPGRLRVPDTHRNAPPPPASVITTPSNRNNGSLTDPNNPLFDHLKPGKLRIDVERNAPPPPATRL